MDKDIAIKVEDVSKTFRIPHEKVDTLRGAFVNVFRRKTYEKFKALDGVSFQVKKGEFFGIIGRNGSGKSTLLKLLAGIYTPDSGKIETNGLISPFLELGIGFDPELSGRDNIFLNAAVLGMAQKEIKKKFEDIVAFSELERFIDQKLKNYSSGMQVRLAFSVAIHANRDILLLDEVLAVGDANFQKKCLDIFRKIKSSGKTIVFVSHDQEAIGEFCDRVLLLSYGKKVIESLPEKAIFEYSQVLMNQRKATEDAPRQERKSVLIRPNGYKNIEICNLDGDSRSVFRGGEDIKIKITLEIKEVEKEMHLAVAVNDEVSGVQVCGNNTSYEKRNIAWQPGINQINLVFKGNYFNRGEFFITSRFFKGDMMDREIYDYYDGREKKQFFQVIPKNRHGGLTHLPHEWRHKAYASKEQK